MPARADAASFAEGSLTSIPALSNALSISETSEPVGRPSTAVLTAEELLVIQDV